MRGCVMFATLKKPVFMKICALPFSLMLVSSMSWAIAVLYALDLGANTFQVNLISTIRQTMGIFLLVPFGILSDRLGRKPMILYSRALIVLGTFIYAFAGDPNHLLIASFVGGFAGGGVFPILLSMIGDIAKRGERREAISTLFLFSSIGMLLGPIICTLLLALPQITLRSIYQIQIIAQIGILLYMVKQLHETKPNTLESERIEYRIHISDLLHQRHFQSLLVMSFLYFFSRSIINTYIPIYARIDLNLSDVEIASLSIYRNLAIMLIRFLSATALSKIPIRSFLISALILGGLSGFTGFLANNYISLVLVLFTSGLSYGATAILGNTLIARNSTSQNRGVANSLYTFAQSTGNFTLIFTSPIADGLGFVPMFLISGATALLATTPILLRKPNR